MFKQIAFSVLIALLSVAGRTQAFPEYIPLIPNGLNLVDPCHPEITWHGVGHLNPDGGGPRNSFGMDFAAAGRVWTRDLCQKDSDGDGKSNGEELGDPDCVWVPGATPARDENLSHPGVNENDLQCS